MGYRVETHFEVYQPIGPVVDPDNFSYTYKVPARGCNSIWFIALPMRATQDEPFSLSAPTGYGVSDLLEYVPQINGIPLLPTILNHAYEAGHPRLGAATLADYLTRLQAGDRLEFNNAPGVVDETIYDVKHQSGIFLGFRVELMVVRRYLFEI